MTIEFTQAERGAIILALAGFLEELETKKEKDPSVFYLHVINSIKSALEKVEADK